MCALFFIYVLACAALIFSTLRDGHSKCVDVAAKPLDKTVSEKKNEDDDEVSQKEDESDVVDDEDKSDEENEESSVVEENEKKDEEVFGSILTNSDPFWCDVNPSRVLSYHKMVLAQKMRKNSLTSVYSKTVQQLMMESMDKDGVDNKENGTPVAKRMIWKVQINNVGKNFCNRYKRCSDGIGIIIPQKQGDSDSDDVDDLDFDESFCGQSQKWKYFGLSLRDGKCHHSEKQKGGRKKRRNGNGNGNGIDNDDDDSDDEYDEYDSYDDYDDYDNYDNYDYGDYNDCEWDTEDDEDEYDGDNRHYGFKKGDRIVIDFDMERGILSFYRNDNIDGKVVRIKNFLQCVDINKCRLAMDICDEQACYFLIDYQCEYDIEKAVNVMNKASVDSENETNETNEANKEKNDTFEEKKEMELGMMKKHLFGIMQELIDEAMSNMTNELKKDRKVEIVTEDETKVADVKDNKAGDEVNTSDDNDGDEMDAFDNDGDNKDLDGGNQVDEVDQVDKVDAVEEGVDHVQISDDEDDDDDDDDSMELDID